MRIRHILLTAAIVFGLSCSTTNPPGPGPDPGPDPVPVPTHGELNGVAVDQNGKALEGVEVVYIHNGQVVSSPSSARTINKTTSDNWCSIHNLPASCNKAPPGYFSRPGEEEFGGSWVLRVKLSDGRKADTSVNFDSNWTSRVIAFNIPEPPKPVRITPPLALGITYYTGLCTDPEVVASDFKRLRDLGFTVPRIFVTWTYGYDCAAVYQNGSLNQAKLSNLRALIRSAWREGMVPDLTFAGDPGSVDRRKAAITSLLNAIADLKGPIIVDVMNEFDSFGTPDVVKFVRLAGEIRPDATVIASISLWREDPDSQAPAGTKPRQAAARKTQHILVNGGSTLDLAAPHFPRDSKWVSSARQRFLRFACELDAARVRRWKENDSGCHPSYGPLARPIYDQEPQRRNYNNVQPNAADFFRYFDTMAQLKEEGWNIYAVTFHSPAMMSGARGAPPLNPGQSIFDRLDSEDKRVVMEVGQRLIDRATH